MNTPGKPGTPQTGWSLVFWANRNTGTTGDMVLFSNQFKLFSSILIESLTSASGTSFGMHKIKASIRLSNDETYTFTTPNVCIFIFTCFYINFLCVV